jgi:RNA methyltransferase, TrmH family
VDDAAPYEPIRLVAASQNQIRSARRLLRRSERLAAGRFLAEGPQAVREALGKPGVVSRLFVSVAGAQRHRDLITATLDQGVEVVLAPDREHAELSDTVTPQGLVAVCSAVDVPLDQALSARPRLVVCCAQVRDPGNAGTVIRCADAFGAGAVVLSVGSVDPYNSKTVRASAGSLFHLPLVSGVEVADAVAAFRQRGMQVLAADGAGESDLDELSGAGQLVGPTAWLMGNEAWGLPAEHAALADRVVRVPLYGGAESLNLSSAAAVCLYATASAQRNARPAQ